jgi:hypothetical protein
VLAFLLLAVAITAIAPAVTLADNNQTQNGTITINATGQGKPIYWRSSCGPATLSLTGSVGSEGRGDHIKLNGLTGSLQLGNTTYQVLDGRGEANKKGMIQINAHTNGYANHHYYQLVLNGRMNDNQIVFSPYASKLSSLCFLSLSGQVSISTGSSTSTSTSSSSTTQPPGSGGGQGNVTITQTVTQTVTNGTTTTQFNNSTTTITVTSTAANTTITETVTSTVANTTITETSTTTVANTTITVFTTTNSTISNSTQI